MEKVEWLIDKLKHQFDAGAGAPAMLATLQVLQQELAAEIKKTDGPKSSSITVLMPAPQWNANADVILESWEAETDTTSRGDDEQKVVYELEPYVGNEEEDEKEEFPVTEPEAESSPSPVFFGVPPVSATPVTVTPPPVVHASYVPAPPAQPVPAAAVQPVEELPTPAEKPASVAAVEMPKPLPDTDQKSLNDLHEKPANEVFVRLQEPVKDLKKAISINERYQYINSLFKGDESAYDRSIKTINSFHVFGEAEYWIRREISTKYSWQENDETVQQFYDLVRRRFA